MRRSLLLKVGASLMLVAVVLAAGVALFVASRDEAANGSVPLSEEEPRREPDALPVAADDWPMPEEGDLAAFDAPRRYEPEPDAEMTLTVPSLGLVEAPVLNSDAPEALDRGVIHLPQTPMPWDGGEQKNVYIAGHRLGYPGTGSHLIFYNLGALQRGDKVIAKDREGRPYRYRVSEVFIVGPRDTWVADPVRGRDMITLQTCTPIPTFENRLVVRADRI